MQIVKHTKDNVIVNAIREGLHAIGRAQAQAGHQIFLAPTDWEPGDELLPVEVTRIVEGTEGAQDVALTKDDKGETWGFWL
jgi:hypothetical protein